MVRMKSFAVLADEGFAIGYLGTSTTGQLNHIIIQKVSDESGRFLDCALVASPIGFTFKGIFGKQDSLFVGALRAEDAARISAELGGVTTALALTHSNKSGFLQRFKSLLRAQQSLLRIV